MNEQEVIVDMDGATGSKIPVDSQQKLDSASPRIFELCGRNVEERIFNEWAPGLNKLVWCYQPIEHCVIEVESGEGMNKQVATIQNMLVHIEYKPEELEQAREKVMAKFIEYHGLSV